MSRTCSPSAESWHAGRVGHHDRRHDTQALARDRRGRRCPRHSGAAASQREGSKAVPAQADGSVRRSACRRHRQAAQLHKANSRSCARGGPPGAQGLERQGRGLSPSNATARENHGGGSSHPGRPRDFSALMTRSKPSSSPAVTNSLQCPTATPAPTPFGCGVITPWNEPHETPDWKPLTRHKTAWQYRCAVSKQSRPPRSSSARARQPGGGYILALIAAQATRAPAPPIGWLMWSSRLA